MIPRSIRNRRNLVWVHARSYWRRGVFLRALRKNVEIAYAVISTGRVHAARVDPEGPWIHPIDWDPTTDTYSGDRVSDTPAPQLAREPLSPAAEAIVERLTDPKAPRTPTRRRSR